MKSLAVILTMLLFFAVAASGRAAGQTPGAAIKNFYVWYIQAIDSGTDPFVNGRKTLLKFVTPRLVKQIERAEANGADVDVFLSTQEFDASWADKATTSNIRVNGATATAIVTFDAATNYPRVSLALVKEAGAWKIDWIRSAPFKP